MKEEEEEELLVNERLAVFFESSPCAACSSSASTCPARHDRGNAAYNNGSALSPLNLKAKLQSPMVALMLSGNAE